MEDDIISSVQNAQDSLAISLTSSSTKYRTQILKSVQQDLQSADLDSPSSYEILKSLLATYPRYQDRHSRQAVRACLVSALQNETLRLQASRLITDYVLAQSQRTVIATSDAFVLLEWCVVVQQQISKDHASPDTILSAATLAAARSLEKCLRPLVRPGVQRSALVLARRGLRSLLEPESLGSKVLTVTTSTLIDGLDAATENLPYLGIIAGVCARIPSRKPEFEEKAKNILSFYAKTVIGCKYSVPTHIASSLHDLFASFVSREDILGIISPSFEKAILRSPEVVLDGLIPSFVNSLPADFDLSQPLSTHLLQPLLSSLRSTNSVAKDGAVEAFSALVQRCKDVADRKSVV